MYRLLVSNFVSFFAPFLLILQLNQDKIGCKSEAKRNKKRRRNMNQADIEKYAFCGCSMLASITISNSVTSIADRAFESCWSLKSITIPNNVISIVWTTAKVLKPSTYPIIISPLFINELFIHIITYLIRYVKALKKFYKLLCLYCRQP